MPDAAGVSKGLEDVLAGTSAISTVDGIKGRLIYRGLDIRDLVASSTFEETTYLLWYGTLPTSAQLADLHSALTSARALPPQIISLMQSLPKTVAPMAMLRTVVSALAFYDVNPDDRSPANLTRIATLLTAQTPTIVAAWDRLRKGLSPVAPRSDLAFSANFLYMLTGKAPDKLAARTLDEALIMHADHEFNASTFAVRVVVGTLADLYSAVVAGIGALKGPSHGGANQDVMSLLTTLGDRAKVEPEVMARLAKKVRIPGFGHRVYKTYDPRALLLKARAEQLGKLVGDMSWFDMSLAMEEVVIREKKIYPNVDFYSASTYHYLGIPTDMFTAVFVMSRMAGWTAHALEQYADNRLIRPRADYTGPMDVVYTPIEKR
jgi:citrate synthase